MKKDLIKFMNSVAEELRLGGYYGTAHIYKSSLNALCAFNNGKELPFTKITPEFLKHYESHLRQRGCSWNTVSTYLRTLRATYNRAIDNRTAPYVPHLFKHVYTGTRADKKRALDAGDMALLLNARQAKTVPQPLNKTQGLFVLMFLLRGLPFVDLAYMHKKDLSGNVITYRRRKTGRELTVTVLPDAMELLDQYTNTDAGSPYLFPILHSKEDSKEAYREYQLALRMFNSQLALLGNVLGIQTSLSTYAARHTWATMAYHCEVHPGIISEAMGHSSITVTETYLKPFRNKKIDEANMRIIEFTKQGKNTLKY